MLRSKVVNFLSSIPDIDTEAMRRALILGAGLDDNFKTQISYTGSTWTFCQLLISTLVAYGELESTNNALEAVLNTAKELVGIEKKELCETLIQEWKTFRKQSVGLGVIRNKADLPEASQVGAGYIYDVYLSYREEYIGNWVNETFLPVFKWHCESSLGRNPEIFYGKQTEPIIDTFSLHRKTALAHSRCLLSIWSPSYFRSYWSRYECAAMLYRESQLGYPFNGKLIIPVIVSDGKHFPQFTLGRIGMSLDCKLYAIPVPAFKATLKYIEFEEKVKNWVEGCVAEVIQHTPPWREDWLNDPPIALPEIPPMQVAQPVL